VDGELGSLFETRSVFEGIQSEKSSIAAWLEVRTSSIDQPGRVWIWQLHAEWEINRYCHAPREHLPRSIDHFLDPRDQRCHLAPFYRPMGWPSADPALMIRRLIAGSCFGLRSERHLCVVAQRAFGWPPDIWKQPLSTSPLD